MLDDLRHLSVRMGVDVRDVRVRRLLGAVNERGHRRAAQVKLARAKVALEVVPHDLKHVDLSLLDPLFHLVVRLDDDREQRVEQQEERHEDVRPVEQVRPEGLPHVVLRRVVAHEHLKPRQPREPEVRVAASVKLPMIRQPWELRKQERERSVVWGGGFGLVRVGCQLTPVGCPNHGQQA